MEDAKKATISVVLVFLVVLIGSSSVYTIDAGERGVLLKFGKVSRVSEPGLNFKLPWPVENVVKISTRTFTLEEKGISAYSKDQQLANLRLSVTLAVKNTGVQDLYTQFKNLSVAYERIVAPVINKQIKTVFGQYTAVKAVQERAKLNVDSKIAIVKALEKYSYFDIKSVQIENIDFSKAYEDTIEARMKAEVEVERFKQNLEREKIEAEIVQTQAQAQADAKVRAAKAEAQAIELRSVAEAEAINVKGRALRANPQITNLIKAESWNGVLPTTMLPNSSLPMVNVK